MKLLILLFPAMCFAKEFHFVFHLQEDKMMDTWEYKTEADTWKEAHRRAALACATFFTDRMPVTENAKWEIFDACMNPSEK